MAAYDALDWHDFYVMTGGAAAALTGLLFVAMSLHSKAITSNRFFSNRAIGSLLSLMLQLFISAAVLVPQQTTTQAGAEVELGALFFLVFTVSSILRGVFRLAPSSAKRRVGEWIGGIVWIALFLASGVSLILEAGGGFYLLAIVMVLMFGWNVYNAWILIAEVSD